MKLPTERAIHAPDGGWQAQTLYLVEVSMRATNPIHYACFFCGFLNGGKPGGYSELWNPTYEGTVGLGEIYFMRPVRVLHNFGVRP